VSPIPIPRRLSDSVASDGSRARREWLAALPDKVRDIAANWKLELGEPYPEGQSAWVAPVRTQAGEMLVLKVQWRHWEAEHEADALRLWDGDGAVRCVASRSLERTRALLLEQCTPGSPLSSLPEPGQDVVLVGLLRRLWEHQPPDDHPFMSLQTMCDRWADALGSEFETVSHGLDPGLARAAIQTFRTLPRTADRTVLLCTDLHAGNVLSSHRQPWLAIDPKPFIGDPAYDIVQHMLNCDRLADDPAGLATRMAALLDLEPERVNLWLFARCTQKALRDPTMRPLARRLAP
jgi:streptomycin 6-kinase